MLAAESEATDTSGLQRPPPQKAQQGKPTLYRAGRWQVDEEAYIRKKRRGAKTENDAFLESRDKCSTYPGIKMRAGHKGDDMRAGRAVMRPGPTVTYLPKRWIRQSLSGVGNVDGRCNHERPADWQPLVLIHPGSASRRDKL